jgi:hypothetical protein
VIKLLPEPLLILSKTGEESWASPVACSPPTYIWGILEDINIAGGQLEILFVVDSQYDPAFQTASALAKSSQARSVSVLIATLSNTNSQKIHNIQTGIKVALHGQMGASGIWNPAQPVYNILAAISSLTSGPIGDSTSAAAGPKRGGVSLRAKGQDFDPTVVEVFTLLFDEACH